MTRSATEGAWDHPVWTRLGWALVGVQLFGCGLLALAHGSVGAPVLAMFAAISAAALHRSPPVPALLAFLFAAASVMNAAGWIWNLYDRHWWYDDVLHFLMPFALVGGLASAAMRVGWRTGAMPKLRFMAATAAVGLAIGLAWEGLEAIFIVLTWPDTLLDLAYDTAGAAFAGCLAWRAERGRLRRASAPPEPRACDRRWPRPSPEPRAQRG